MSQHLKPGSSPSPNAAPALSSTCTPNPARLIVLGIDAARPELLEEWTANGTLPNLSNLIRRGVSARVRGVEGFFIGSTWPSLYTGTNPAQHGVHYLLELVRGSYELRESAKADFVRRPPFWRALNDTGQRVAVLDVPLTRLEPELHGVQIVEWGGHDSVYGFRTSPPQLADEILQRYGVHPVGSTCDADHRAAADYQDFAERLELGALRKGELSRDILAQGNWDLFMQVFTEAHCAGHQCWHLHDVAHPAHDATTVAHVGDPLKRAYVAIDREIGKLLELAPNTPVVVFSAHGMSHWYGAQFLLHEILVKLGASVARDKAPPTFAQQATGIARSVWRSLPAPVRATIKRLRSVIAPARPDTPPAPSIAANVHLSRCFVHPNGLAVGGIRLNLGGREPQGVLKPGEQVDAFVLWLRNALLEIVDERTGAPAVKRVLRTSELYAGENLDLLPDLLVEWSDTVATGSTNVAAGVGARVRVSSPLIGVVEGENDFGRTGEHRADGWMVAAGPGIKHGLLSGAPSIFDLAPTFTAMLGVELAGTNGKVIGELTGRED